MWSFKFINVYTTDIDWHFTPHDLTGNAIPKSFSMTEQTINPHWHIRMIIMQLGHLLIGVMWPITTRNLADYCCFVQSSVQLNYAQTRSTIYKMT